MIMSEQPPEETPADELVDGPIDEDAEVPEPDGDDDELSDEEREEGEDDGPVH